MYLHIGKDRIIYTNNLIGIFDIDSLKVTKCYNKIMENIKVVEDLADEKKKTLIIVKEDNQLKAYITNILSTTIAKRNY